MTDYMQPWQVQEQDFPRNGTDQEKMAFFVRYAVLAPSIYNTQPWHFAVSDNQVHVYADRRHALAVIDPDDRQLNMCCAAALFSLRLAIHYFGYKETTELIPDPQNPDLLARVKLGAEREMVEDDIKALFKGVTTRHTNRGAFSAREVPEDVLHALKSEAAKEGAWFHVCSPIERKLVVRMVSEADHIQSSNKHFRRELASWVDQRRWQSRDGMPNLGLGYNDIMGNFKPTVARRFCNENNEAASDETLDANTQIIGVIGVSSGGLQERLSAGQALMRVLLRAEIEGLAISTLNQACEVPELRLRLHDELEPQGRAQMIMRIGYGGTPSYTPRRAMENVLSYGFEETKPKLEPQKGDGGFQGPSLLSRLLRRKTKKA
jgi:hypothetical protein